MKDCENQLVLPAGDIKHTAYVNRLFNNIGTEIFSIFKSIREMQKAASASKHHVFGKFA
jgi:hypothetical protein